MSALAIGSLEVLRFFRRPSTAWVFIVTFAVIGGAYGFGVYVVWNTFALYTALDVVNRVLMTVQVGGLCAAAWVMGRRSIAGEVTAGSFPLLIQTPIPGSRIVLGKLLGLAAILLFVQCLFALVVMLPAPLIRRPVWVFHVYLVVGWLLAVSMLPAGLADGLIERKGGRRWLRHLSWVLRFVGPMLILQGLILPESRAVEVRIWDVALQAVGNVLGSVGTPATSHFAGPGIPIAVIMLWFVAMAVVDWYRAVGRLGRVRG